MTMNVTAAEAWYDLCRAADGGDRAMSLVGRLEIVFGDWFSALKARIAADKDAEIAQLKTDLEMARGGDRSWSDAHKKMAEEKDAEIKRLSDGLVKADVARSAAESALADMTEQRGAMVGQRDELQEELDRLKPKPPKTRKTAGEKLYEMLADAWGSYDFPGDAASLQRLALRLDLTDDPGPISDGELLKQVMTAGRVVDMSTYWDVLAAEFLDLRANAMEVSDGRS